MNKHLYAFSIHPNQDVKIVDQVIAEADPVTLIKITNHVSLPIEMLITPNKTSRRGNTPRPQNSFVIYRRDFMAKLSGIYGPELSSNLPLVSSNASKWWNYESEEIKDIYKLVADMAKEVHRRTYPDYVYKPKKKRAPPSQPQSFYHFPVAGGPNSLQTILPPIHTLLADNSNNYDRRLCR